MIAIGRRRSAGAAVWLRRPSAARAPRTTVLMPAYDSNRTIRESVESVLAQTVTDWELIVVDDAGGERAADALAGIDDDRIGIARHARNANTSGARNTALAAARAPLVSQLDADDRWEPDYLATVLPRFGEPDVGLVYSNASIAGHPDGLERYIGDPSPHPIDRFPAFAEANPIPALTATMRTHAVRAAGGYARWLWSSTDYHLYAKLIAAGWRFAYVDRPLACYRWPGEGAKSASARRVELADLKLWTAFALRHPLTPGPRRQVRAGLRRELGRAGRRARNRLSRTIRA